MAKIIFDNDSLKNLHRELDILLLPYQPLIEIRLDVQIDRDYTNASLSVYLISYIDNIDEQFNQVSSNVEKILKRYFSLMTKVDTEKYTNLAFWYISGEIYKG